MLSRVANSIYWMSRYMERAENVARFIHVNVNFILDYPEQEGVGSWEPLVITSGDQDDFFKRFSEACEDNVLYFLIFDEKNPNSILSCLMKARENGRALQDTISSEMWEALNQIYLLVQKNSKKKQFKDLNSFLNQIKSANHLFVGISDSVMSHSESWHFLRLGRLLERADKTARILDVKYFALKPQTNVPLSLAYESIVWAALLKSVSSLEMYRKIHNRAQAKNVLDFLILNHDFPRSLYSCLKMALDSMKYICLGFEQIPSAQLELKKLFLSVERLQISELLSGDNLHHFIDKFQQDLNHISNKIDECFFAAKSPKQKTKNKAMPSLAPKAQVDSLLKDSLSQ